MCLRNKVRSNEDSSRCPLVTGSFGEYTAGQKRVTLAPGRCADSRCSCRRESKLRLLQSQGNACPSPCEFRSEKCCLAELHATGQQKSARQVGGNLRRAHRADRGCGDRPWLALAALACSSYVLQH